MTNTDSTTKTRPVLVIHGGAGVIRETLTTKKEKRVRADLESALHAGYTILRNGGSSIDAVSGAVVALEDAPYFNAGKGAVFTHDGHNELDAAIMDGATLQAGAVAGVRRVRNPVLLARAIMERSPHVMLSGDGAEKFAQSFGIELVDPSYFRTDERWQELQQALRVDTHGRSARTIHYGTVGAVALDAKGHLAAATSTGGTTDKRWGRVGDSPIIGAGTYANAHCAVSATGWGEYFLRVVAAHAICARMEYCGESMVRAAEQVIMHAIPDLGGDGGAIALDSDGNFATPFNTEGMYRGWVDRDGTSHIAILEG
ncbi:MAG: isoaspartyl peptidase/L-asparaginase [Rhodanobacteraceae bacterium]